MAGRPPEPDDEREPTPDADDIDVRFADITASLGDITVPPDERDEDASRAAGADQGLSERVVEPPRADDHDDDEDAGNAAVEPGFAPPEPPPLIASDPLLTLAWVAVCVAVVLVLVYLMLWRGMPGVLLAAGGVVFVVAVGVLVWRMPVRRDADDHDDGAVV